MKRRQVLTGLLGLSSALMVSQWQFGSQAVSYHSRKAFPLDLDLPDSQFLLPIDPPIDREQPVQLETAVAAMDNRDSYTMSQQQVIAQPQVNKEKVNKSIDFARDYDDDIFISEADRETLQSLFLRLQNVQKTIGYGHFNIVSFDQALAYGKRFNEVGKFTQAEISLAEQLFTTDASTYGFYGDKVSDRLTQTVAKSQVFKVPRSGHYLFKGESLDYYEKLRREVGDTIILTSGVRGNVKQLYLFVAKAIRVKGNLSRASRSLAPPGYSYHGIGDFDVGRTGWGAKNFTDDFAKTDEFKRMQDLGYIAIRYDHGNNLGVRFEPWHIKVV